MLEIYKEFVFDAAHWLPNVPDDHKCRNLHGHTYYLKIWISGELDENAGWIEDFGKIKSIVSPILKIVDHKLINEIAGLDNPTCELFCMWWYEQLKDSGLNIQRIELQETPTSGARYEPRS